MKKILPFICTLIFYSCSNKENIEHLIFKGNLAYSPNSETPYTGKIFGLADKGIGKLEGYYEMGLKDGTWTKYLVNGNKNSIETYNKGILEGERITLAHINLLGTKQKVYIV